MTRGVGWWGLVLTVGMTTGCSKGDVDATTGFDPGPWMLPGDDDGQSTDDPPPQTTGDDSGDDTGRPGTTGGVDGDGSTSGPPPPPPETTGDPTTGMGGTFGDDGGNGMQPGSGWWAHCVPNMIACDPGFACLSTDAGSDGVCTMACNPAGSPAACGASPGGTNMPVCLSVGGDSVCALGCDGGLTCPGGMICVNETDDTGPISICI